MYDTCARRLIQRMTVHLACEPTTTTQARWKATTDECFQDASQTSDQATLTLEIELAMRLSQLLSSKGLDVPEGLEGYHGSTKMLWGENGQVIVVMDDGP